MHPILSKLFPSSFAPNLHFPSSSPTDSSLPSYIPIENEQISSSASSAPNRSKRKKRRLFRTDLNLLYRLMSFKMPTIILGSLVLFAALTEHSSLAEPTGQRPSYIEESNPNPYSVVESLTSSASEGRPRFFSDLSTANRSVARRSPQWTPQKQQQQSGHQYNFATNHGVMVATGRPNAAVENLTTSESMRKEKRQIVMQQPETFELQQQIDDTISPRHYQCDSIIRDSTFHIESPHYPATYPVNRICTYYIARNRNDVCQVELSIVDMDIEDTAQCTADYLDLGGGQTAERLCGLMLRNSKRLISFPTNGSYIRITFHSDHQNSRPYRGFSAEVRQLPSSCFYPTHGIANGTLPTQVTINGGNYGQRLYPTTRPPQVWIGGPPGYPGARPGSGQPGPTYIPGGVPGSTGSLFPPYMVNTTWGRQPGQYPGQKIPGQYPGQPGQYPGQQIPVQTTVNTLPGQYPGQGPVVSGRANHTGPIFLASYCDVYLGEVNGELRSPGYPFGYPTNHSCIYTVKKAFDDVCQLELIFHHFDIQTPDAKKDLTDSCQGDYLELPDHSRLCGYYNQAMSRDHVLKKFYLFPDTSDYLFLQFISDTNQTPDGSGFWIEAKQLRNTCVPSGVVGGQRQDPNRSQSQQKCDRLITGEYSTTDRIYSPNYPNFYSPRQQCVYFIRPADASVCEFELDLVTFQLEDAKAISNSIQDGANQCTKDYLQLPNRSRICGRTNFRRIFPFPKYHDRTAMFYFTSDEQVEDRGYEIVLRQLPNTCTNQTYGSPGALPSGTTGNTQNVYTVNDPNIRYNPTPVFTFHNASGIQPYYPQPGGPYGSGGQLQPPTIITSIGGGPKTFGSKKSLGPSYSIVPVVNDPRNVDSSGTIPLYYANGSLATRIPPLKPVDMIPFLKKGGKGYALKSGSSIVSGGSYSGFNGPSQFGKLNLFNSPSDSGAFQPRSQSNSGLFESLSPPPLQHSYNCDQVVSRPVEYLRSPNFPSNYPTVTRCIYTILKLDNNVCQVRLQLLNMDLEYTTGCKNDYFLIETTGEKICGRISAPENRLLNFFGHSREIRLIFNSDRQLTAPGFEVRVEQIPDSCHGQGVSSTTANLTLASVASISQINSHSARSGRLLNDPNFSQASSVTVSPMAAALSFTSNRSAPLQALPITPIGGSRICRTSGLTETYFESDNYPNAYPTNTDCLYKIFRSSRKICRLEIELLDFDVGNEIFDSTANSNSLPMTPVATTCPNDYMEIDGVKYCGRRPGQKIAVNFPRFLQEVSFRFLTVSPDPFAGFRIKVRQIDENCRSASSSAGGFLSSSASSDGMSEFSPATIESCPKLPGSDPANPGLAASAITEQIVRIQSPKFGLSSTIGYEPFLDCHYLIQKYSRDICAVEIKFESFAIEESRACSKDYLEINGNVASRICGKMVVDTVRNFEFASDSMRIRFHSDAERNDTGFAMVLRQIRC